jgi:tetratricopeptide (TPR) repeat protein
MKSEHRHELKTNELAEWLGNLPQWAKENSKTIVVVVVLAIVILGFYGWRHYDKNVLQARERIEFTRLLDGIASIEGSIVSGQSKGVDYSYELITYSNNLKAFAESARRKNMAAMAFIKYADVLRKELQYRLEAVSEQDRQEQINRAKAAYTQAMQKAKSNPTLLAAAKFGLGLCVEELGNFEEAGRIYQEIASNEDFAGTVTIVEAKERLNDMSEYQQNVVFKPAPKVEPQVATEPMMQINPVDMNTPVEVNLSGDTNMPVDVNSIPQKFDNTRQISDVNLTSLPLDDSIDYSDVNVPVE